MRFRNTVIILSTVLTLSACAGSHRPEGMVSTDEFLDRALSNYGVGAPPTPLRTTGNSGGDLSV